MANIVPETPEVDPLLVPPFTCSSLRSRVSASSLLSLTLTFLVCLITIIDTPIDLKKEAIQLRGALKMISTILRLKLRSSPCCNPTSHPLDCT